MQLVECLDWRALGFFGVLSMSGGIAPIKTTLGTLAAVVSNVAGNFAAGRMAHGYRFVWIEARWPRCP
jgi:hypothetical protein